MGSHPRVRKFISSESWTFNGIPNFVCVTYLLKALVLMLFVANCARFFTALLETTFRLGSLRLCVEFRQRRLLKLMGPDGGWTCFNPDETWSTESCLRSIFLLSPAGLSFKSIDFCLRNRFFALFGWNCCRMVDIPRPVFLFKPTEFYFTWRNIFMILIAIQYWYWAIFTSFMQISLLLFSVNPRALNWFHKKVRSRKS